MPDIREIHSGMIRSLQRLGRHTNAALYSVGGAYEDATVVGDYKIQKLETYNEIRYIIWNPKEPCVSAVFYKDDNTAVIDSIAYSPRCTIDGRMMNGIGPRKMIQTIIDILKKEGAKSIFLQDNSYVMCKDNRVPLGLMRLFTKGETWYEYYFGFKPSTPAMRRKYEDAKIRIPLIKDKPCDYFTEDVLDELVKEYIPFWYRIEWELTP